MRIPILVGRPFDASDDSGAAVVISRRLAMQVYGTLNVLGRTFPPTLPPQETDRTQRMIVGIAEETSGSMGFVNNAEYYLPFSAKNLFGARLLVRARSAPGALKSAVRGAARRTDSRFHVDAHLVSADYANSLQTAYLTAGLASGLASLTLFLACIGVFSVISYGATLRRKELSVRRALGATRRSVVTLLIRQSAWPAAAGMVLGFGFSIVLSDILNKQLRILGRFDPSVLASAAGILSLTCGVAALLPAIRAVRGDIAQTLRND
jgi:hypothetical protein